MENSETIREWIDHRADVELYEFNEPVISVTQAVEVSGHPKNSIIKTIIVKHKDEDTFIACIITASARVDKKSLRKGTGGKRWRMATKDEIKEVIGYPAGGVPPVRLGNKIIKYVDPRVLKKDFVIAGGGTINSLMGLPPKYIIEDGAKEKIISFG